MIIISKDMQIFLLLRIFSSLFYYSISFLLVVISVSFVIYFFSHKLIISMKNTLLRSIYNFFFCRCIKTNIRCFCMPSNLGNRIFSLVTRQKVNICFILSGKNNRQSSQYNLKLISIHFLANFRPPFCLTPLLYSFRLIKRICFFFLFACIIIYVQRVFSVVFFFIFFFVKPTRPISNSTHYLLFQVDESLFVFFNCVAFAQICQLLFNYFSLIIVSLKIANITAVTIFNLVKYTQTQARLAYLRMTIYFLLLSGCVIFIYFYLFSCFGFFFFLFCWL